MHRSGIITFTGPLFLQHPDILLNHTAPSHTHLHTYTHTDTYLRWGNFYAVLDRPPWITLVIWKTSFSNYKSLKTDCFTPKGYRIPLTGIIPPFYVFTLICPPFPFTPIMHRSGIITFTGPLFLQHPDILLNHTAPSHTHLHTYTHTDTYLRWGNFYAVLDRPPWITLVRATCHVWITLVIATGMVGGF